ncbi:MAG: tRNA (adenosine(37)-N6)-dimethylallyltransferase MiaA [Candidatus Cloacimonetes bacterium]|nr:tRNA (adenosine(37)-N6)-dimethylallyltransferase MiaA [Candidatus Cloacimonadota bacterium]
MIPIITIEGPTASGKSAFSLELASYFGTQIISADSRQVYRYMDIGTAKVSKEAREIIPHHLVDIINPDESFNAGLFAQKAAIAIRSLHESGKIPIICGGTGLYIRSLLDGLFAIPALPAELRENLKQQFVELGRDAMFAKLQQLDADFAAVISSFDTQRVLRGLEVAIGTGIPLSEHWRRQQKHQEYKVFKILLNPAREILYHRINSRLTEMLNEGLIQEINSLLSRGYLSTSPGLNSLGYKEFMPYFMEQKPLQDCANMAAQHHRNYAKRQCTWYRKCIFDLTFTNNQINLSELAVFVNAKLND